MIAVPLRYGSRVIGTIVISKLGRDQFDEDDVRLLEVLAGHASVALENARLYEAQRREAANLKALLVFTDEMARAQSLEAIAEDAVDDRRPAARRRGGRDLARAAAPPSSAPGASAAGRGRRHGRRARPTRLLDGRQTPFVIPGRRGSAAPARDRSARTTATRSKGGFASPRPARAASATSGCACSAASPTRRRSRSRRRACTRTRRRAPRSRTRCSTSAVSSPRRRASTRCSHGRSSWRRGSSGRRARRSGSRTPRTRISSRAPGTATRPDEVERIRKLRFDSGRRATSLDVDDPFLRRRRQGRADRSRASTFAVAPIRLDGGRLGCIVAAVPAPAEFDEQRMRLLAGIAHQAKLAIANAAQLREPRDDVPLDRRGARERARGERRVHVLARALDHRHGAPRRRGARARRRVAEAARAGRALPRHRQDRRPGEHPLEARPARRARSARSSSCTPSSASASSRRSTGSPTCARSSAPATSAGTAAAIPTGAPARRSRSRRGSSSSATPSTR